MQHLRRSPPTVNIDGQGTATEERLERDDFESRFPELTLPCTAESTGGNDYSSAATCCHVLERLSVWNRVLWHVGLQLRELMAPGELSLVHVSPTGCGFQQQLHGRDARLFFYALLTRHRCVVSVDLDEALVEGSGLGECRKHVVSALRQNTSLQALRLGSLFCNYRFIQEDMLAAITTLPHLQKLVVSVIGAVPPCLVDALRYLLETTSLSTLSISGLIFDEDIARRLLAALRRNHTVADLSVHSSITRSQLPNEVTEFSHYLATSIPLSTLTIEGVHSNPETTRSELRNIVTPLVARGTLLKLRLSGFLLDDDCAYLLSQLVARKGGALQHLDICGCRWRPDASTLCQYAGIDCNQLSPASSKQAYASLHAFDDVAQVQLSFLSLSLAGLTPDDCRALFGATAVIESLKTISISDVALAELPEICRAIRDTGMIGRVRIKDEYLVDSAAICVLWNFREEVCHVAVSSLNESSAARFHETVRLVCSWYHVTTLRLFLSQEAIGDISTMWLLYKYLNGYSTLRELELAGCDKPDLSGCPLADDQAHRFFQEALFASTRLPALRVSKLRLGEVNLFFLVTAVLLSETLCELEFSSWDSSENDMFIRFLADDIERNETMLHLHVSNSTYGGTEAERAIIEQVLGRNMGFVTCAAHFVVRDVNMTRCVEAFSSVYNSPALIGKVRELVPVDEAEATNMIQTMLL